MFGVISVIFIVLSATSLVLSTIPEISNPKSRQNKVINQFI